MGDINLDSIKGWFQVTALDNQQFHFWIKSARPVLRNPKRDQDRVARFFQNNRGVSTSEKMIIFPGIKDPLSIDQLVQMTDKKELFQGITPESGKLERILELFPKIRKNGFQLLIENEKIIVNYFEILVELEIKRLKKSSIRSVKSYESNKNTMAHIINFDGSPLVGNGQSLDFICIPEGEGRRISIRIADSKKHVP